jgi:hypothetical protein
MAERLIRRVDPRAWRCVPFLVFAILTAITWRRWFMPFHDSGREVLTALLLAGGRALYVDVSHSYGPLPAYLDAAALRLIGRDLDVLVALRMVVALLGLEALRRLTRRVCNSEAIAGATVALVVAACCFRGGGNWPFPYSVAALEGTVGVWWALELALASRSPRMTFLAAVVAGLAGGTKIEFLPLAVLAIGPALLLRRPRREAAAAIALGTAIGLSAFAFPVIVYGSEVMRRQGFLIVLSVPESWKMLYRTQVLFRGTSPHEFFAGGFLRVWGPSVLLFGALAALCRARLSRGWRATALTLLFVGTLAFFLRSPREELAALIPAPVAIVAIETGIAVRRRRLPSIRRVAVICMAIVAIGAAARQPFFLRNASYGAFTAPLAIAVSLAWVGRRVRMRQAFALFIAALAGFHVSLHALHRFTEPFSNPVARFEAPGMRVVLPATEARLMTEAVAAIEHRTPKNAYVACFPEPGFLLLATGRRHPFVDTQFHPGVVDSLGEAEMIRRLRDAPVAAVLVTNRRLNAFGEGEYGSGVLDDFLTRVERDFPPPEILGDDHAAPAGGHATMARLFVRQ